MAPKHSITIDEDGDMSHSSTSAESTPRKRISNRESRTLPTNSQDSTPERIRAPKLFHPGLGITSNHYDEGKGHSPTSEECEQLEIIEISEMSDLDEEEITPGICGPRNKGTRLTNENSVIDLDSEDDTLSNDVIEIDGIYTTQQAHRNKSPLLPERNKPIVFPCVSCSSIESDHGTLRPGTTIEIKNGDFLFLKEIVKNCATDHIDLRGYHLQRTRDLNGILPKLKNELCWIVEIELEDPRHYLEQSVAEVPLEEVVAIRQLRLTNRLFPACSFRKDGFMGSNKEIERGAPLTLRWRYFCTFNTAKERLKNEFKQRSIEMLSRADLACLDRLDLAAMEADIRTEFRGRTIRGGDHILERHREHAASLEETDGIHRRVSSVSLKDFQDVNNSLQSSLTNTIELQDQKEEHPKLVGLIDLETNQTSGLSKSLVIPSVESTVLKPIRRAPGQKYTYGDSFSGAGGATRGAVMAGLHPKWAMDNWPAATQTFKMNFSDVHIYEMRADQFVSLARRLGKGNNELKVDILHLSPPCQYFSPAHTIAGKDDEMNTASLFACGEIISVVKPRIVTLEQTAGIIHPRHRPYFNALIHMFTSLNFSIRWQIAPLQDWGLPARRARLIMIAACPGEVLPEFPEFTHSPNGENGLKPYVSVNSVLHNISPESPDHNPDEVIKRAFGPWDASSILPKCITTSGGQNWHPSGLRDLTNRELAALQGFPNDHIFGRTCQTSVKKQIGNGVPPCVSKVLFEWIRKHLEKVDGVDLEAEAIIID